MTQTPATRKPKLNPMLKLALDIGPLVVFFAANAAYGIFRATAIFMATIVVAFVVSYVLTRHIAVMPVVTAVVVLVFGSLTLVFHDETFIKIKPTIIYPLGGVLHRDGGGQRNRLAHPEHGFLGQLQAVRIHPADLRLRDAAISAADEIRRRGAQSAGGSRTGRGIAALTRRLMSRVPAL